MPSVSIQLVSPASGDRSGTTPQARICSGFHSIGVPSEWGPILLNRRIHLRRLLFPFNWCPQRVGTSRTLLSCLGTPHGFHSIGVPSEWGLAKAPRIQKRGRAVSIQLVSPASGDGLSSGSRRPSRYGRFPFNWCPQRVGTLVQKTG